MFVKFETKKIIEISIYQLEFDVREMERLKDIKINLLKETLKNIKMYGDNPKKQEYKIKAIKAKIKYLKEIQDYKNKINFIKYFLDRV